MIEGHDLTTAPCPRCEHETRVDVLSEQVDHWNDQRGCISGTNRYWILKCRGCENIFFGSGVRNSENEDHEFNPETGEWDTIWPEVRNFYPETMRRNLPSWANYDFEKSFSDIAASLEEAYLAFDRGLLTYAAFGSRIVFDLVSQRLGADGAASFEAKVEFLAKRQFVSHREHEHFATLVKAGNAAAHQFWKPSKQEIEALFDLLESLIHRNFVLPKQAGLLKQNVPNKQERSGA